MLTHLLLFLAVLSSNSVYVKGNSREAAKARQDLQARTCYALAARSEDSDAVLQVDHLFSRAGDQSVVMVLLDRKGRVLWEGKTEEDPIPLRSPVNRLLKRLAKSTCPASSLLASRYSQTPPESPSNESLRDRQE